MDQACKRNFPRTKQRSDYLVQIIRYNLIARIVRNWRRIIPHFIAIRSAKRNQTESCGKRLLTRQLSNPRRFATTLQSTRSRSKKFSYFCHPWDTQRAFTLDSQPPKHAQTIFRQLSPQSVHPGQLKHYFLQLVKLSHHFFSESMFLFFFVCKNYII